MIKILITGDLFISDHSKPHIDKKIVDLFLSADYRIVNLEAPITLNNKKNKILKTGPHLRMSEDVVIPYLKLLKIDCVTLANNHILDYGEAGIIETLNILNRNSIKYLGVGKNKNDAIKPISLYLNGINIAFLNFCENEWSIADESNFGASPLDVIDNYRQIKNARLKHDKVICIIHGGHEYYNLPSPRIQKLYKFFIEQGADAILSHHSHVISGYENYNSCPIIYSLGNFIFTNKSSFSEWYKGQIIELNITSDTIYHKIHFIKQTETFDLNLFSEIEMKQQINLLDKYNSIINNPLKLQEKWDEYIKEKSCQYINLWSPVSYINNKYLHYIINKIVKFIINNNGLALYLNLIRCDSHRDLSIEILKKKLGK